MNNEYLIKFPQECQCIFLTNSLKLKSKKGVNLLQTLPRSDKEELLAKFRSISHSEVSMAKY